MLSVKQPLSGERGQREVLGRGAAIQDYGVAADPGLKPGLLAVWVGYVPAGTVNEYAPMPFVVAVRLPRAMVAPEMGLAPSVTVPESVPFPTVVQPGKWNAPMRV